jgi:hypothetical protein
MAQGIATVVIEGKAPSAVIPILETYFRGLSKVLPFCHPTQSEHHGLMVDTFTLIDAGFVFWFRRRQPETYLPFFLLVLPRKADEVPENAP